MTNIILSIALLVAVVNAKVLHLESDVQSCLNVKCHTAAGCALVIPLTCADRSCQRVAKCVEDNPCLYSKCSYGFQCRLKEVECEEEPCNPRASCEPWSI